jgi:hypothetical protein
MAVTVPELTISPEKVCFLIVKARAFDAKDVATDHGGPSDATDDAMASILESRGDDPVVEEIARFIAALNEDEQIDLVTLTWLGRGDGAVADWSDLRAEASRAHNRRTAQYLLGIPLLADYLEEGLAQLGSSCEEFELGRL